jgi:hypothetical protein
MTALSMTLQQDSLFRLPRQDLAAPSFFQASGSAVNAWIEQLPKANLGETSRQLYEALQELNRVKLHSVLRLELLDALRPSVHFAITALSKHYLNQPIVMPEKAQKVAEISHTLSDQLATGYILVALHADGMARSDQGVNQLLSCSLHRAISELGEVLLLHTQLYRDPPAGTWLRLHQMMLLAQQNMVDQETVLDTVNNIASSVTAAYLRAALLGAARPFQLRQQDMSLIAKALQQWSPLAQLIDWPEQGLPVLAVNPAEDLPPRLGTLLKDRPGQCFALCTDDLVAELQRLYQEAAPGALTLKIEHLLLPVDLLKHLIHAWSEISKRNFMRLEAHESVDLCLGLSATHHFLAGGIDLETLLGDPEHLTLSQDSNNRFLDKPVSKKDSRNKDIWDSAYETNFGQVNVTLAQLDIRGDGRNDNKQKITRLIEEKFFTYQVDTINLSPGGYCVSWPPQDPAQIRTGEIIGIREHRSSKWSVGVIRWAKNDAGSIQLGLELISPSAQPYGARIFQKSGEHGDFLRVLLLPELKALGQAASLITPNIPFKSQQKIVIRQNGKETMLQLGRRIAGNSVYSQFAFRQFGDTRTTTDPDSADTMKQLWSSL